VTEGRTRIALKEADVQRVLQIALDGDAAAALEFVREVVHPQVEAALRPHGCRPVFELPTPDARPLGPPPAGAGPPKKKPHAR
jgi:hypothetical protein